MHRTLPLLACLLACTTAGAAPLEGFRPSPYFREQVREETTADGVRVHTNAAGDYPPDRPTLLVVYLLPNGNTIEQTLGAKMAPGLDWHYDIQHIAAQVRQLHELWGTDRNVVLTLMEAPKKSWPAFRKDHPDNPSIIRELVRAAAERVPSADLKIALVGHSGGGSFLFGYINSPEPIPPAVERIAWLDANYAYSDDEGHAEKLLAWLRASAAARLVVFAYDDRNVKLNGKNIVSETGGTWGRSQAMIARLAREQAPIKDAAGPFERYTFLNGRVQFFLHPNPETKILHTAMIGEMNAFLHAMTVGTRIEGKYGQLGGPRAYTAWIQPAPAATTLPAATTRATTSQGRALSLPAREVDAVTGSALLARVKDLSREEREKDVVREVLGGNVPAFLRQLKPIHVTAKSADGVEHTATYWVTADVVSVGSDDDFFRMPLTPMAAATIARSLNCTLITRKMSNDVYQQAELKLEPRPLTEKREAAETFYQSHQIIEDQRRGKPGGLLVAGIKKDVVITNRLKEKPNRVAIFGWHKLDGKAIQPLYVGHVDTYVDYSHGTRLVSNEMDVDGRPTTVRAVLADPDLCGLLSDEGPIVPATYPPATQPSTAPAR
jgi:hypothetical protein